MKNTQLIFPLFLCPLAALFFSSCGDIKGASEPLSFAPSTSSSLWIPPSSLIKPSGPIDDTEDFKLEKHSLSLAEVLDIALHNSPQTKKSWNLAKSAAASYGQSLKDYFLTGNLTSMYDNFQEGYFRGLSGTNSSGAIFDAGMDNTYHGITYGAQLSLSYTVLDFGQTRATSKAALAALYEADFTHNKEIQKVMNSVMNVLYDYLAQKARVEAAVENVKNATIALDSVNEKFKFGVADLSDTLTATTKLLEEKLQLVSEQKALTYNYTHLITSMGYPANAYLTFENFPQTLKLFDSIDLSSLIEVASCSRPDLQAAKMSVKMHEEKVTLAKAQKYPVVSAGFEIGRENANLGIGSYFDYMLSINLNFPLFQGFFIENGIKKASADLEASRAKLRQIQLEVIREITNVYHDISYAKESYLCAKEFLASAELDFKVSLQEYKSGTSTIVELINSQTAVANARAKFIDTQKFWYSAIANLSYSTGLLATKESAFGLMEKSCDSNPITSEGESF